tara:strand:+ start:2117 stop:2335 length:219 start_codon:yes stop_codon:yes gene_type:complete
MDRIHKPWEAVDRINKAREIIGEMYDEYVDKPVNNSVVLDPVIKSVCTACSGSGCYCGVDCGACDGTGLETD